MSDGRIEGTALGARAPALGSAARWGLALVLPVAAALAAAAILDRPLALGALAAAAAALALLWMGSRRVGVEGVWVIGLVLSVLAGEMSALPLGGQSGRLLWTDAVLAVGVAWAMVRERFAPEIPRAPFLDATWPILGWSAATLLVAVDPLTAVAELKEWLAAAVVGIVVLRWAGSRARARAVLGAVAATGALLGVLMAHACLTSRLGPVLAVLMKQVDLPWGRSNYLAGLLILAIPVCLGLMGEARSLRARLGWGLVLLPAALGLALSASKGAILALGVGLLVAFGRGRGSARAPRLVMAGVVVLGVLLFAAGPLQEVLRYRLQAGALDYSASERVALYRLAWDEFTRHPLLGLGLNNFSVVSNRLHGVDTVPHNLELGFLAELGLPGLALALAWLVALGAGARRAWRAARTPGERSLALGVWAAFIGFAVHNQFESTLYGQQFKVMLMATAAATWRLGTAPLPAGSAGSQDAVPVARDSDPRERPALL